MIFSQHKQRGIGIIEVLISLVVLAVGLLAVATLHTSIIEQSGDNKARAEAVVIAQQRLEELRNYSANAPVGASDPAEFETLFTPINNGNSTSVTGTNAIFTRTETIADSDNAKALTVFVRWTDKDSEAQMVTLNSAIGWTKPRSAGDLAADEPESLVPSATGRAHLGDGTLPSTGLTSMADGVNLMDIDTDGKDVFLSEDDSDVIVLTLEDACNLDDNSGSECSSFVEISGRVYIDTGNFTGQGLKPGDVYVKASDAAYCQMYYTDGTVQKLVAGSETAAKTANDYVYYDYTCYLGGGWHGNIGLILKGGIEKKHKICQGDPTSSDASNDPVIAARRVYRGMTHTLSGTDKTYYSIGVKDGLILPAPGFAGHDFVISWLGIDDTTGDNCITQGVMVREDSKTRSSTGPDPSIIADGTEGILFEGIPTDFFCLNEGELNVGVDKNYVDTVKDGYLIDPYCPYDPSDPPVYKYVVTGTLTLDSNVTDITGWTVTTSDGEGTCTALPDFETGVTTYAYTCDVYDWGTGWNGYVQMNANSSEISCTPYRDYLTNVTDSTETTSQHCVKGAKVTVTGTITPYVQGNSTYVLSKVPSMSVGERCEIAADGLSYSCYSDIIAGGDVWLDTTISFTGQSKVCINTYTVPGYLDHAPVFSDNSTEASVSFTGINPGTVAENNGGNSIITVNLTIIKSSQSCRP